MIGRGLGLAALLLAAGGASGRGASPYLPLKLSPEFEHLVERVLILADKPVLTRPIAAATVLDALPAACERDPALCERVRRYLRGYAKNYGLGYLGVGIATTSNDAVTLPERHGMPADSSYELSGQVYWQPANNIVFSGGLLAYDGETTPTGTMLSFGIERAQIDIGYRDHWFSPMTGSAMTIGVQAPTMPSLTLSNYTPLTRWGFRYEIFIAEMSESRRIASGSGLTTGNPRLAGVHLSIEPVDGWSLGINRLVQYGGGNRPESFSDLFDAFVRPSRFDNRAAGGGPDNEFGNQIASITSQILMPGPRPFSVYFEYAGEDTSKTSDLYLGNSALSAGVFFPTLRGRFDLTAEVSEWQNSWYTHHIYRDGLRHQGSVIGHWGGDWRVPQDGVGGRSFMTRVGWQASSGAMLEATLRILENEDYSSNDYERGYALRLGYSRTWREFFVGAELDAGKDTFGTAYSRVSGFLRF
jgi:hypothetical protein